MRDSRLEIGRDLLLLLPLLARLWCRRFGFVSKTAATLRTLPPSCAVEFLAPRRCSCSCTTALGSNARTTETSYDSQREAALRCRSIDRNRCTVLSSYAAARRSCRALVLATKTRGRSPWPRRFWPRDNFFD